MKPLGSKLVNLKEQLRPGCHLRLTISAEGASHLLPLLSGGQLKAKERVHKLLRHAAQYRSWPEGAAHMTLRVDPSETFDIELFVSSVWPLVHEGFVIPASPKKGQRRTRFPQPGVTNRDRVRR